MAWMEWPRSRKKAKRSAGEKAWARSSRGAKLDCHRHVATPLQEPGHSAADRGLVALDVDLDEGHRRRRLPDGLEEGIQGNEADRSCLDVRSGLAAEGLRGDPVVARVDGVAPELHAAGPVAHRCMDGDDGALSAARFDRLQEEGEILGLRLEGVDLEARAHGLREERRRVADLGADVEDMASPEELGATPDQPVEGVLQSALVEEVGSGVGPTEPGRVQQARPPGDRIHARETRQELDGPRHGRTLAAPPARDAADATDARTRPVADRIRPRRTEGGR